MACRLPLITSTPSDISINRTVWAETTNMSTTKSDELVTLSDQLREVNQLLDAAYLRLGRLVVAVETASATFDELPSIESLEKLVETASRLASCLPRVNSHRNKE